MNIPDDPFILELLPEFLDSWIADMDTQFAALVAAKNENDTYRLAHTLKGSCFQFGIDEIGRMGVEIMALVRAHEWDKVASYEEPLKQKFLETKQFIEANLNK